MRSQACLSEGQVKDQPHNCHERAQKKASSLRSVNQRLLAWFNPEEVEVVIRLAGETEAEADEMWAFVQCKRKQRWLWHAIDHYTGVV